MTLEEFQELTKKLLENNDNVGTVSDTLVKLRDGFSEKLTAKNELENKFNKLEKENNSLRETNMQLYLKTGIEKKDEEKPQQENNSDDEIIDFSDFVDEKGNLK